MEGLICINMALRATFTVFLEFLLGGFVSVFGPLEMIGVSDDLNPSILIFKTLTVVLIVFMLSYLIAKY